MTGQGRFHQASDEGCTARPTLRVIARLDIKGDKLIKSIQLEGVRVIGDPQQAAQRYYEQGADEILLMDAVASLYGRNSLDSIIRYVAQNVFVPITVGGGLRSIADVDRALRSGADKVAINTAAVQNPALITEVARRFGAQCMVLQLDAKRQNNDVWEPYVDGGRERSYKNAVAWAREAVDRGAGEILLTAVDREGTRRGFDIALCKAIADTVSVPVVASGGMGTIDHLVEVAKTAKVDAVAIADIIHLRGKTIAEIKSAVRDREISVRQQ